MSDLSALLQGGSGDTQSDLLIQAYRRTEQPRVDALLSRRETLEQRKSFFTSLRSKLNVLISQMDKFQTESASDKFITRKTSSSDSDIASASANSNAIIGVSTLKVNRLATNDMLISDKMTLEDSFGVAAGTKSFDVDVNGESVTVSVTFDGDETNEDAIGKIAKAVNSTEDIQVSASMVKDTETTGRLTFTARETGEDFNIQFTDTDGLLANFGIDASLGAGTESRTVSTESSAGFRIADKSDLNSQFIVNGITVERNSNSPDDVLPGISIDLLKSQDAESQELTFTTDINRQAVEDLIQPLLDAYNDVLSYLRQQRSISRTDLSIGNLFSTMRGLSSERVSGLEDGAPSFLTEIGIEINTDGKLLVDDRDVLEDLLKDDPQKVADIFTSSDGFVAKVDSAIASLVGENGLILSRTRSLTDQIENNIERTEELNARIDTRADALRNEYQNLLEVYYQAESQLSLLSTFPISGASAGGYSQLLF